MELRFGTSGIRDVMGPGPGQMNRETVRLATLGAAGWLGGKGLVVISRDSRNNSLAFALETARTFERCGIRALMFEDIMPVPALSFAVRYLHADAGVMITASHNSKEYNGYKLYGPTGGQLLPEEAAVVQEEIKAVPAEALTPPQDEEDAYVPSYVPEEVYGAYLAAMRSASDAPKGRAEETEETVPCPPLSVIYTPLNGSGRRPAIETLTADGYDVFTVPEQEWPDGDFTTTGQPNPEFASVYRLALDYAKTRRPDVIIATDPDADRTGVMSRTPDGSFKTISGNQMGALLLDYIITWGPLALIVIFQPEIRNVLEQLGRSQLLGRHKVLTVDERERIVYEIMNAVEYLKKYRIGALIVIERDNSLIEYIEKSKKLYANISSDLLESINSIRKQCQMSNSNYVDTKR